MRKDRLCLFALIALILSGCSVFEGSTPLASAPDAIPPQAAEATEYTAPTLPPVNTPTLAPTMTQTPPPTPSPFTIVIVETPTLESGPPTSMPAFDFNIGDWERYETTYTRIAFDTLTNLAIQDYGRLIRIGDPSFSDEGIQLFVEFQVDQANSSSLPEGINPSDPRSIIDGILREYDRTYSEVTMIRSVANVNVRGYPGSNTAVRTQLTSGSGTDKLIWFLAVVVHEETVVRIYAQSPDSTGGVYLSFAQHMMETIEFLPEP